MFLTVGPRLLSLRQKERHSPIVCTLRWKEITGNTPFRGFVCKEKSNEKPTVPNCLSLRLPDVRPHRTGSIGRSAVAGQRGSNAEPLVYTVHPEVHSGLCAAHQP